MQCQESASKCLKTKLSHVSINLNLRQRLVINTHPIHFHDNVNLLLVETGEIGQRQTGSCHLEFPVIGCIVADSCVFVHCKLCSCLRLQIVSLQHIAPRTWRIIHAEHTRHFANNF